MTNKVASPAERERDGTWMPLGVVGMLVAVCFMGYVVVSHQRPNMPHQTLIDMVPSAQR